MGDEAGGAVVDARGPVHHLVRRVAHLRGGRGLSPPLSRVLQISFEMFRAGGGRRAFRRMGQPRIELEVCV